MKNIMKKNKKSVFAMVLCGFMLSGSLFAIASAPDGDSVLINPLSTSATLDPTLEVNVVGLTANQQCTIAYKGAAMALSVIDTQASTQQKTSDPMVASLSDGCFDLVKAGSTIKITYSPTFNTQMEIDKNSPVITASNGDAVTDIGGTMRLVSFPSEQVQTITIVNNGSLYGINVGSLSESYLTKPEIQEKLNLEFVLRGASTPETNALAGTYTATYTANVDLI